MKKALLFLLACAGFTTAHSQTTIMTETFTGGAEGWVIENLGTSPEEFRFTNINPGFLTTGETGTLFAYGYNSSAGATHNGHTTATSPAIDCSTAGTVFMEWEQIYSTIQTNSTCKVEVSNDSTTWTTVYSNTAAVDPSLEFADLTAVAANQAKVWIRFDFKSTGDRYWIIDDLKIFAPEDLGIENLGADVVGMSTGNPVVTFSDFSGSFGAEFSVRNLGGATITSLTVDYSINGGANQTLEISDLNIAALDVADVLLADIITPSAEAFFTVDISITHINGIADTDLSDNDASSEAILFNPANAKTRKPVIEVFTSSTCAPCRPGNTQIHSVMDSKDIEEYVMIKYQQNFPGTGDPYCTTEAVNRRGYYGINSIPNVKIDGGWGLNGTQYTNNVYNQYKAVAAVGEISGTYDIDEANQTVNYDITFTPNFDFPDDVTTMQIVIMEKLTDNNVKSNGELVFENVMKKMIGGENGTLIKGATAGTPMTFKGSYKFNGNYRLSNNAGDEIDHATEHSVEEFSDLEVVAFVQALSLEQILAGDRMQNTTVGIQENASFFGVSASPNPFSDNLRLNINSLNAANANVKVISTLGKVVFAKDLNITTGLQNVTLSLSDLASGIYTVVLESNGTSEQVKVSKF